jgi:hypothetical protein
MNAFLKFLGSGAYSALYFAPQPNWRFNADANKAHGFAILMGLVGALRASRSGAG